MLKEYLIMIIFFICTLVVGVESNFFPMTTKQAIALVKQDIQSYRTLDTKFRNNKDVILTAVSKNKYAYRLREGLNEESKTIVLNIYQDKKEIVLKAISQNKDLYRKLHGFLKEDKDLVLEMIKTSRRIIHIQKPLRTDKGFFLDLLEVDISKWQLESYLEYIDKSLFHDLDFATEAIKKKPITLQYAKKTVKNNKGIVLMAIKRNGDLLRYASEALKNDKQVVLVAMLNSNNAYAHAGSNLKKDKELSSIAVMQNGCMLRHVSDSLKRDKELVVKALNSRCKYNDQFYRTIDKSLLRDKDVALAAIKTTILGGFLPNNALLQDRDFIKELIKQDVYRGLYYMHPLLRTDKAILIEAFEIINRKHRSGLDIPFSKEDLIGFVDKSIREEVRAELDW